MRERLSDPEMGQRYELLAKIGQQIFAGSALISPEVDITNADLALISQFHKEVSPSNLNSPWRSSGVDLSLERGEIADPSTFANWEIPGGPLEHIELSAKAGEIITRELKNALKKENEVEDPRIKAIIRRLRDVDPMHVAAAAGLHDEGRELTHVFYTNEVIGDRLLDKIGIREDLRRVLPDEKVLLISP